MTKRIYVAHGAITNSGDHLIFEQGWALLQRYVGGDGVELIPVRRWEPITGECDALIILGGPIISRKMHVQAINIMEFLKGNKVPVICLGIGIAGKGYSASEPFFTDQESVEFWTEVYNRSHLLSVRDTISRQALVGYNIPAILTGCPALFDLEHIDAGPEPVKVAENAHNLTITIPNFTVRSIPKAIKTFYFLRRIRKRFSGSRFPHKRVVFQHGYSNFSNKFMAQIVKMMGMEAVDGSNRSIKKITEIGDSTVHIGTRLHTNIYFLSRGLSSYLLSVDNRTDSFLDTITTPSAKFDLPGIRRLVDECYDDLVNDRTYLKRSVAREQIVELLPEMKGFLTKIRTLVDNERSSG